MKFQVKRILIPTDFSETSTKALAHASYMARLTGAEMVLIHVLPANEFYFEIPEPMMVIDNQDEIRRLVEQRMGDTAEHIHEVYGMRPRRIITRGKAAREIMQAVQDEKVDLIIMGTHGADGFEELFIGSNAHKVVSLAPCPVITIQSHARNPGFGSIVLPIDRSRHSREKVDTAIGLALLYNSTLHVLGLLEETDDVEYNKLQIVLDQVVHAIEKAGAKFTRHTVKGDHLAAEALKYGQHVNADLIMIMTDHESAITGIFMGPLAKQIVNHSRIPVMSIKPHYGSFAGVSLGGSTGAF